MRSPSTKNTSAKQIDKFRDHARFVIEHHFGSRPTRIRYLSGGLSNFVFEVKHAEETVVVRISPEQGRLNAFIKEHWCERAAREAGVPTAEILETGAEIIPFPYVIARRVEGIEGSKHNEPEKIAKEIGRLAAIINSIRTHGFGETFDWSNNELSRNRTYKEYLEGEYKYAERIETLERARICPAPTIKKIQRICREMTQLRVKPVLNHGDLRLKNVIAGEDGKIKAIIDWEKSTSNIAPHWEFSMGLHDLGIDLKQAFVDGYGIKPGRLADVVQFVKVFNLLNYTDEILRVTADKDKAALERLRLRFAGAFDLYSLCA